MLKVELKVRSTKCYSTYSDDMLISGASKQISLFPPILVSYKFSGKEMTLCRHIYKLEFVESVAVNRNIFQASSINFDNCFVIFKTGACVTDAVTAAVVISRHVDVYFC